MNFKYSFMLLAAVAMLAACAVKSTTEGTKPTEARSGLWGMNKADDLAVDNAKAFAGKNQVIIGSFKIGFLESKKDSAKAGSGMGGKSTAKTELTGVTPEIFRAVTNAAYADFVAKLQSSGYTVVDNAAFLASADYASLQGSPNPTTEEASFFGATHDITFVAPDRFRDIKFFMGEAGKGTGLSAIGNNPYVAAVKYAKSSGTPVISVYYTIDYVNAEGSSSSYALTSSISVGQGISTTIGSGVMFIGGEAGGTFGPNPNGSIKLGQGIGSDQKFGELVTTSTGAGVAAETALNLMTAVLGGGTNQTRSYEIKADPVAYQTVATAVVQQTNAALIGKMASMK